FPLQWPSAAPLAGRGRDVTLLFRLFVLVAVALLPAIAIQAYNEFDLRRARQVEVRDQALSLARLVASDQQQIVQAIPQVRIALSELQSIKTRNRDACNSYLGAMQRRLPGVPLLSCHRLGWPLVLRQQRRPEPGRRLGPRLLRQRRADRRLRG